MAETKINIGDTKAKKTYNKTLNEEQITPFLGKRIGDKVPGDALDLAGYEFEITGGSDNSGFPMRKDVNGTNRKRVLITGGVGLRKTNYKGSRIRKTVAGNTVHEKTAQINVKVVKHGKKPIEAPAESEKKEEKTAENASAGEKISKTEEKGEKKPTEQETKPDKNKDEKKEE